MNRIFSIIICLILISPLCFGQEKNNDSTEQNLNHYEKSNEIQTQFYKFQVDYELNNAGFNKNLTNNPNTIWLWTSYSLSSNNFNRTSSDNTPSNILSPLYRQYMEESKFDPVRYVLRMAEFGAVGYLAYRHIKKYGFWK